MFVTGRSIDITELQAVLEMSKEEIQTIIAKMQENYEKNNKGIEIIKISEGYQLCTKKENYEYIYQIIDKRNKPKLSNAALETLSIIAYNPKISRPEIEAIRGVNVDGTMYKLLEYGLIEESGKIDLPGRPMSYRTTDEFLRMFGYTSIKDLPELPRYKVDENHQIIIDEIIEENLEEKKEGDKNEAIKNGIGDN